MIKSFDINFFVVVSLPLFFNTESDGKNYFSFDWFPFLHLIFYGQVERLFSISKLFSKTFPSHEMLSTVKIPGKLKINKIQIYFSLKSFFELFSAISIFFPTDLSDSIRRTEREMGVELRKWKEKVHFPNKLVRCRWKVVEGKALEI